MTSRTSVLLGALALAFTASAALAQKPVPAMPDDTKAIRASGVGLRVSNLERSMKFYTEVLGFKVASKVQPAGQPVREYLLGLTGNTQQDTLVVLSQGDVKPDATTFGRIVLVVPSGRKMAQRVADAGFKADNIKDGTNIVRDPDGYVIELYQRPAPAAAAPAAK